MISKQHRSFYKMQGTGNDFIIVYPEFFTCLTYQIYHAVHTFTLQQKQIIARQAIKLCDRRFGIGADGVLVLTKDDSGIFKMNVVNSDGTWAKMCGNGLRCVAHALFWHKSQQEKFQIQTDSGKRIVEVKQSNKQQSIVRVWMGTATEIVEIQRSSFNFDGLQNARIFKNLTGNEQIVVIISQEQLHQIQSSPNLTAVALEIRKSYQANVNFCAVQDHNHIRVITYELGAGLTLACGTGSTACALVAHKQGLIDSSVSVEIRGGNLQIFIQGSDLYMTGPAVLVYEGLCPQQI